jgi:branched-chain amino acid aminotransferase
LATTPQYFNYNGKVYAADDPVFHLNRAINYGDGLFEGMRIHNGEILFFEDHIDRMLRGIKALKMDDAENFSDSFFHKQIIDLARQDSIGANARVRIGIFRTGKGLYEPIQNAPEFFIEILPLEKGFEWNEEEVEVGIFEDVPKNFSSISFFKSMNALPSVMASIYKENKNLDDCLLLNSSGKIADAISSNVFWIENRKIFSPPISDGGVEGVMRKNLIRIFDRNNFTYQEKSITPQQLKNADEIFLTNVSWAIKSVTKFESSSYSSLITKEIFSILRKELTP